MGKFSFPTLKLLSKLAVENESMEIYTYFFRHYLIEKATRPKKLGINDDDDV
jgi:hypothetical protein